MVEGRNLQTVSESNSRAASGWWAAQLTPEENSEMLRCCKTSRKMIYSSSPTGMAEDRKSSPNFSIRQVRRRSEGLLGESLVSYHIHIHSIRLKLKEGGFNNHGYVVFKERWDMGKRSIEWMRNIKGFLRAPPHPYTHSKHTHTHTHIHAHSKRRLYCIYIWMSITKGFAGKRERRTSCSTGCALLSGFSQHENK